MGFKIFSTVLLFTFQTLIFGQEVLNRDSLERLLPKTKGKDLVELYIQIGQQYEGEDIKKAKSLYKKAGALSKKIGYDEGQIRYIANYTYILNVEGKFEESLALNLLGVKIAEELNDDKYRLMAHANTAVSYHHLERYEEAQDQYLMSLKIAEKTNDKSKQGTILSNLSALCEDNDQNELSLQYAKRAVSIARQEGSKDHLTNALINQSIALTKIYRFKEADLVIKEGLQLAEELQNDYYKLMFLLSKCNLLFKSFSPEELETVGIETLRLSQDFENPDGEILSYIVLAQHSLYSKKNQDAKLYSQLALEKAKKFSSNNILYLCYNLNSQADLVNGNSAGWIMNAFYTDSIQRVINQEQTNKALIEAQEKFETEKKNLEIINLKAENDTKFWLIFSLILGILTLLILLVFAYKSYENKKVRLSLEKSKAIADERLRIAQDMHDDVGSGLSRIRYLLQSFHSEQDFSEQNLKKAMAISDESIQNMSEIIWALGENNQTLEELIVFISRKASEILEPTNIRLQKKLPEAIPQIVFGWEKNRNTYFLVKEALNNVLKHAQAKNVTLSFRIENSNFIIELEDDGIGFDSSQKKGGNGLRNFAKRIEHLGGSFEINTQLNQGTKIKFVIQVS